MSGRLTPSVIVLVLANLVVIYGALFLKWRVFPIIFLFWFENVIIGFFNVLRILLMSPEKRPLWIAKLFMVPFFVFHYGMFTAIHGLFVLIIFGDSSHGPDGNSLPGPDLVLQVVKEYHLLVPALCLFGSHGFSFVWNYIGGGEYRRTSLNALMSRPYGRIVILHMVVLGGSFLVMALKSPLAGLLLLIIIKIGFDIQSHMRERKKLGETPNSAG